MKLTGILQEKQEGELIRVVHLQASTCSNGCPKCISTYKPVLNAAITYSKEHVASKDLLQQITATPPI